MIITPDLHPDDVAHRRDLIAALRALRRDARLRLTDVAESLHVEPDTVSELEHSERCPFIATVQRYARALGCVADPVLHGITTPETADIRTYVAVAASSRDLEVADAAARSLCIARLTAARRHQGLTRSAIAARIGITGDDVHRIEAERREPLLSTYQRYARAMGGRLTVELRPVVKRAVPPEVLPCGSDSARRRHRALGQVCRTCGVGYEPLSVVVPLERAEAAA